MIAPLTLILQDDLEEVEFGELGITSVGYPIGKRWKQAGELKALEHGFKSICKWVVTH
jgi:hypothetical protein